MTVWVITAGGDKLLAFSAVRSWLVHLTASEIDGGWGQQPIHIINKSKLEEMAWHMRTNLFLPLSISGGGWPDPRSSSSIPQDDPHEEAFGEAPRGLSRETMSIQLIGCQSWRM